MRVYIPTIALLISMFPTAAQACSCSNGGPLTAARRSSSVFLGRVVTTAPRRHEAAGEIRLATFRVTTAIKGATLAQTFDVEYLVDTGGNCGLALAPAMDLLVYAMPATDGQSTPSTNYCTGTKLQECAAPDLRALGVAVPQGSRDCNVPPPKPRPTPSSYKSTSRARHLTIVEAAERYEHSVSRQHAVSFGRHREPIQSGARSLTQGSLTQGVRPHPDIIMGFAEDADKLGSPDLSIAGLQVWVHWQPHRGSDEPYDADWLTVSAHCGAAGASIWVRGELLTASAFEQLRRDCVTLYDRLAGRARLASHEPNVNVVLESTDTRGHFEMVVEITPDHLTQTHRFTFPIDQSYLPGVIAQCQDVLARYPNPHASRSRAV